ncbi:uncharacterized protein LOC136076088 [Hydra vulgaris]|uniref:Uncharacterized protein LOC136076088 n=1 Tax=Hydra vulgaris TaxID=6087 RepID=A0ABM4B9Q0_HYDVU
MAVSETRLKQHISSISNVEIENYVIIEHTRQNNYYHITYYNLCKYKNELLPSKSSYLGILTNVNNRGFPHSSVQQLAIAFWLYATGSYLRVIGDLEELKVNQSTVCRILPNSKISRIYIEAIDGTHIPIINSGGEIPEMYQNRKEFFSLNCHVIAGPSKEILSACVQWPGSVHDSLVFAKINK